MKLPPLHSYQDSVVYAARGPSRSVRASQPDARARSADKRAGEGEAGEHLPANRLRLTEAVWVKSDQFARASVGLLIFLPYQW